MNRFAERLNEILDEICMTQTHLAGILGTTQQTVSRWLHGACEPSFDVLLKLCLILNADPNTLLGYDELR